VQKARLNCREVIIPLPVNMQFCRQGRYNEGTLVPSKPRQNASLRVEYLSLACSLKLLSIAMSSSRSSSDEDYESDDCATNSEGSEINN